MDIIASVIVIIFLASIFIGIFATVYSIVHTILTGGK